MLSTNAMPATPLPRLSSMPIASANTQRAQRINTGIRALNRILRVCAGGLRYEADPGRSEMLVRSDQKLQNSRKVSTPVIKREEDLEHGPENNEDVIHDIDAAHDAEQKNESDDMLDMNNLICSSIRAREPKDRIKTSIVDGIERKQWQRLRFDLQLVIHAVKPYAEMYPLHPRKFVVVGPILGTLDEAEKCMLPAIRAMSPDANPVTGKTASIVENRTSRVQSKRDTTMRTMILRRALCDAAAWEETTAQMLDRLCAIVNKQKAAKTANKHKQKRPGSKKVRTLERLETQGEKLAGEDATLYGVLAARANYLALGRPDLAFATKQLCRDVNEPNSHSVNKLKGSLFFVFYHRLTWLSAFRDDTQMLNAFVNIVFLQDA